MIYKIHRKIFILIAILTSIPQITCANRFGSHMCLGGGFEKTEPPVLIPINGKILIGGSVWIKQEKSIFDRLPWRAKKSSTKAYLQVYDPAGRTLKEINPAQDKIPNRVLAGISTESGIYLGGEGGLFFSKDLNNWESITPFKDITISAILKSGKDIWIGAENGLYLLRDNSIVSKYPLSDGQFLSLSVIGNKVLFSRISETTPPAGYCSPFLISSGLEVLDLSSRRINAIEIPDRKREQAVIQILEVAQPDKAAIVTSQSYGKGASYLFDLKTNEIVKSSASLSQGFIKRWGDASHSTVSDKELAAALGKYYSQQKSLHSYLFWSDVFNSMEEAGQYEELKTIYTATSSEENRRYMLNMLVYNKEDSFIKELLTLAIDRKDYFREDLVRMVDRHKGEDYTALLLRILKEGASIEPAGIGKNIIEPYPCASGAAADALLKRLGKEVIPQVENVMVAASTRPVIRKSIEKRISGWVIINEGRYNYQPPSVRKAEEVTGLAALPLLDDPDVRVRSHAIQTLATTPDKIPFNKLISLLQDEKDISVTAVRIIGATSNPGASGALIKALENKTPEVREWAMIELGKRQEHKAFNLLIAGLNDKNRDVRTGAAKGLGFFKDPKAVPALISAAQKRGIEDVYPTIEALMSLGEINDDRGLPVMLDALTEKESYFRSSSAEALGVMHAKPAVPALIKALHDPESNVRYKAAIALGEIGDPSVIDTLKSIQDSDKSVHFAVLGAINKLEGKPLNH